MAKPKPTPPPHENCSAWDYDHHPQRPNLKDRCDELVQQLYDPAYKFLSYDMRPIHRAMFSALVPAKCKCVAGSYRGSHSCPPIKAMRVGVGSDKRVGVEPLLVALCMSSLEAQCAKIYAAFTEWRDADVPKPSEAQVVLRLVKVLASVLERFFTVHPFANGNGHTGRYLVLMIIARAGYTPVSWGLDDKQPYGDALTSYRSGDKEPLENFLLDAITGSQPG